MTPIQRSVLSLLSLALLATPSAAHEDDPKVLDRQPPHPGSGYHPGRLLRQGGDVLRAAVPGTLTAGGPGRSLTEPGGQGLIDFPAQGVTLLSWLTLEDLGGAANGNDCWGYTSPSGREYALMGLSNGLSVVEISDPSDPLIVAHVPGPNSLWRDVKTYGHHAYVVSEGGGGIQVVDLSGVDSGVVQLVGSVTTGGVHSTHNVAIDEASATLYRCGGGSGVGLRIYRLTNPANPTYAGSWSDRYVHDAQVVTYSEGPLAGRTIAFACTGFGNGSISTGLTIIDVTHPASPFVRAQLSYPGARYSHQAWLSPDRQILYLDDELDEDGIRPTTTHVFDVSNVNAPQHLGTFTNGSQAIGHNLYTKDTRLFQANYRSGLRVFDVSDPANGVEVAYFDTWPNDDWDSFNGLWSCYPFFPSGIVIGSDLEKGLFVWWVGDPLVRVELPHGAPSHLLPGGDSVLVRLAGDVQPGSEKLWYDLGAGLAEAPLVPLGGELYRADLPAAPCGGEVAWFVGARSSNGIRWTEPAGAPYIAYGSLVAEALAVRFADDMETERPWIAGWPGDTATAGLWERVVPIGDIAAPYQDRTPDGEHCWVTGQHDDVDGGYTTLVSPRLDLSQSTSPVLVFWLWLSKNAGPSTPSDGVVIRLSDDDGQTWVNLETITQWPGAMAGGWVRFAFPLAGEVALTDQVRVAFRARDLNADSVVEVAVDDMLVVEAICGCEDPSPPADCACRAAVHCAGSPNSVGPGARIAHGGTTSVQAADLVLFVTGSIPDQFGLFFYGPERLQLPFGDGELCVGPGAAGLHRLLPPAPADAFGTASHAVELGQPPAAWGPGAILPGTTWSFQHWYRDPAAGGSGFNLSDALEVTFCP